MIGYAKMGRTLHNELHMIFFFFNANFSLRKKLSSKLLQWILVQYKNVNKLFVNIKPNS